MLPDHRSRSRPTKTQERLLSEEEKKKTFGSSSSASQCDDQQEKETKEKLEIPLNTSRNIYIYK
jgi:hypothetical protein